MEYRHTTQEELGDAVCGYVCSDNKVLIRFWSCRMWGEASAYAGQADSRVSKGGRPQGGAVWVTTHPCSKGEDEPPAIVKLDQSDLYWFLDHLAWLGLW